MSYIVKDDKVEGYIYKQYNKKYPEDIFLNYSYSYKPIENIQDGCKNWFKINTIKKQNIHAYSGLSLEGGFDNMCFEIIDKCLVNDSFADDEMTIILNYHILKLKPKLNKKRKAIVR